MTVEIVGLDTKSFRVSNISCINIAEGYAADILTESLDVTLRGNPESLAQLKRESIRAVADLTDIGAATGTYMPKVRIYVDGFTDVGAIRMNGADYTVSVEIKRASQ